MASMYRLLDLVMNFSKIQYEQIITPFAIAEVGVSPESAWLGHIPFARWLVEAVKPQTIVELGTHKGASFIAFCEALIELGLPGKIHAVDTWEGDEHAGFYGEDVYQSVLDLVRNRAPETGRLHRMTFDEARSDFQEGSVDILHIDGLHTYDAVRHDFELWKSTVADGGVILFHDISERKDDFGVWKLWDEVKEGRPSFEFHHCHGLGVLGIGTEFPSSLEKLFLADGDKERAAAFRKQFELIGSRFELQQDVTMKENQINLLKTEIANLHGSKSWKVTEPLRYIDTMLKRFTS